MPFDNGPPDHHPHAIALAGGEHVTFDAAVEDRVRRLLRTEARQTAPLGHPLRLDDLGDRKGRGADRPHLAGPHQVGERRKRLFDVGIRRWPVDLVDVDVVRLQPAQRVFHRAGDPAPRVALHVRVIAHRAVHLGGKHDAVTLAPLSALPTISSDSPGAVAIGGIDEVDAEIHCLMDDADAIIMVGIADPGQTSSRPDSKD